MFSLPLCDHHVQVWNARQEGSSSCDLLTFTKVFLMENFIFLCSVNWSYKLQGGMLITNMTNKLPVPEELFNFVLTAGNIKKSLRSKSLLLWQQLIELSSCLW